MCYLVSLSFQSYLLLVVKCFNLNLCFHFISSSHQVFRYFATYQLVHPNGDSEIFMSPDDFLRSITPGMKQPDGETLFRAPPTK